MVRVVWPHLCPDGFASTSLGRRVGPAGKAAFGDKASTCTIPFSVLDKLSGVGHWVQGSCFL